MAKVISPIKYRGTIDDITYRKTEEGNIAGNKTGPTRERVLHDPKFDRTRRNAGEFKLAVKDATLLRHSLGHVLDGVKRTTLNSHVTSLLHAAAMQDAVHEMGCRYAAAGNVGLFEGFEFGNQLKLDVVLPIQFKQCMDAAAGSMKVELPTFIVRKRKGFPAAATHFRIVSAGAAINFAEDRYVNDIKTSALLPLRKLTPEAICMNHSLITGPGDVLVQVLGIQFYSLVNEKEVLLKGGAVKILAAKQVAAEVPAPVEVPKATVIAEPFTAKRLRAFDDRKKEKSFEPRAVSGEQRKEERYEILETSSEMIVLKVDDDAGYMETIPLVNNPEIRLPDEIDRLLADSDAMDELLLMTDEALGIDELKLFTSMTAY